jgi:DNA-binding transcriptional LysR family regulator
MHRVEDFPLALSMGGNFFESFQRAATKAAVVPNVVYRCTSFTQAAQLVRSGACGAILPRIAAPFLAREASIHDLHWLKPVTRDLGIAWHRRLTDIRPLSGNLLEAMETSFVRALKHS